MKIISKSVDVYARWLSYTIVLSYLVERSVSSSPTPSPTTHAPSRAPSFAPTAVQLPALGVVQPAIIYAVVFGFCVVIYVLSEIVARSAFRQEERNARKPALEGDDIDPKFRLQSYLFSLFQLDVGVFSEDGKIARAWHELSLLHPYLALFKIEVNGPATISLNDFEHDEGDHYLGSKFNSYKHLPSIASGTWNRGVRTLRLMTLLSLAVTLLGLQFYIQYPDVTRSTRCTTFKYQDQCEGEIVTLLDTTYICQWVTETFGGLDNPQSRCIYNGRQALNLQVIMYAILVTAIIMALLQWPLNVVFDAMLIAPTRAEYANQHIRHLSYLVGDFQERLALVNQWRNTDNLNALEEQPVNHVENPLIARSRKAMRDLEDIIATMERVKAYRATLTDAAIREEFDRQWCIISNAIGEKLSEEQDQNPDSQFHFAGIARAVDDEQLLNVEYYLGNNADYLNVLENEHVQRHKDELEKVKNMAQKSAKVSPWEADSGLHGKAMKQFLDKEQIAIAERNAAALEVQTKHEALVKQAEALDYVAAVPVRCSTGLIETTFLEMRIGEAKKVGDEMVVQIRESAMSRLSEDPLVLETSAGHEILRFFAIDIMGGLQTLEGRTYLTKMENSFRATTWRKHRLSKHQVQWLMGFLVSINIACIAIGASIFGDASLHWQSFWIAACGIYFALDVLVFSAYPVLVTAYLVPSMARWQIRKSLSTTIPLICKLWDDQKVRREPSTSSSLSAPADLYISRRIAEKFPLVFESHIVRSYNTPWPVPRTESSQSQMNAELAAQKKTRELLFDGMLDYEEANREDHSEDDARLGPWGSIRELLLRLGNLSMSQQHAFLQVSQPLLAIAISILFYYFLSSPIAGTVVAWLVLVLHVPLLIGASMIWNYPYPSIWSLFQSSQPIKVAPEPELEPELEPEPVKPEPEPSAKLTPSVKSAKSSKSAKSPAVTEESKYVDEHPEEGLLQYSSEDDDAFRERVRNRMNANERRKRELVHFKHAVGKAKVIAKIEQQRVPEPVAELELEPPKSEKKKTKKAKKVKKSAFDDEEEKEGSEDEDTEHHEKGWARGEFHKAVKFNTLHAAFNREKEGTRAREEERQRVLEEEEHAARHNKIKNKLHKAVKFNTLSSGLKHAPELFLQEEAEDALRAQREALEKEERRKAKLARKQKKDEEREFQERQAELAEQEHLRQQQEEEEDERLALLEELKRRERSRAKLKSVGAKLKVNNLLRMVRSAAAQESNAEDHEAPKTAEEIAHLEEDKEALARLAYLEAKKAATEAAVAASSKTSKRSVKKDEERKESDGEEEDEEEERRSPAARRSTGFVKSPASKATGRPAAKPPKRAAKAVESSDEDSEDEEEQEEEDAPSVKVSKLQKVAGRPGLRGTGIGSNVVKSAVKRGKQTTVANKTNSNAKNSDDTDESEKSVEHDDSENSEESEGSAKVSGKVTPVGGRLRAAGGLRTTPGKAPVALKTAEPAKKASSAAKPPSVRKSSSGSDSGSGSGSSSESDSESASSSSDDSAPVRATPQRRTNVLFRR